MTYLVDLDLVSPNIDQFLGEIFYLLLHLVHLTLGLDQRLQVEDAATTLFRKRLKMKMNSIDVIQSSSFIIS